MNSPSSVSSREPGLCPSSQVSHCRTGGSGRRMGCSPIWEIPLQHVMPRSSNKQAGGQEEEEE